MVVISMLLPNALASMAPEYSKQFFKARFEGVFSVGIDSGVRIESKLGVCGPCAGQIY